MGGGFAKEPGRARQGGGNCGVVEAATDHAATVEIRVGEAARSLRWPSVAPVLVRNGGLGRGCRGASDKAPGSLRSLLSFNTVSQHVTTISNAKVLRVYLRSRIGHARSVVADIADDRPTASPACTLAHRSPSVLLASTTWSGTSRVAMAFGELGCHVEAISWHRGLLARTRAVRRLHLYDPLRPLAALSRALALAAPDLVVPCDDRSVAHLQLLHDRLVSAGDHDRAAVIARSLGAPAAARSAVGRADLAALARDEGVRAPLTLAVADLAELRAAIGRVALPAMVQVDGTWGGAGVVRVDTLAEAERMFRQLSGRPGAARALKRLMVDRDPFLLLPWLRGTRPRVNVQAYVPGRPANCVVSCWRGEVLAIIQAEVVCAPHPLGPAAIIRIVERPEIEEAARRIVARCRLSGFRGFDFVLDAAGAPHLIEMNPRITPLGHLALDRDRDPVGAFVAAQVGRHVPPRAPSTNAELVAFFPQAWWLAPANPELSTAYHDVPWSEPELVREMIRLPPWGRGRLARLAQRLYAGQPQHEARWIAPQRTGAAAARRRSLQAGSFPVRDPAEVFVATGAVNGRQRPDSCADHSHP